MDGITYLWLPTHPLYTHGLIIHNGKGRDRAPGKIRRANKGTILLQRIYNEGVAAFVILILVAEAKDTSTKEFMFGLVWMLIDQI